MSPMQQAMRARTDHLVGLESIPSTSSLEYAQWSETRMDRWLVDSMLRSGRFNSGKALAQAKHIEVSFVLLYGSICGTDRDPSAVGRYRNLRRN